MLGSHKRVLVTQSREDQERGNVRVTKRVLVTQKGEEVKEDLPYCTEGSDMIELSRRNMFMSKFLYISPNKADSW